MKGHRSAGPSLAPATFAQPLSQAPPGDGGWQPHGFAQADVTTLLPLVYLLGAGLMANLLVDRKSLTRVLSLSLSLCLAWSGYGFGKCTQQCGTHTHPPTTLIINCTNQYQFALINELFQK